MYKIFFLLLASYLCHLTAFAQSNYFEKELLINKIFIGEDIRNVENVNLKSFDFTKIKKAFSPVNITYLALDVKIKNEFFFTYTVYFNCNSSGKISAIIFKIQDQTLLEAMLLKKIGKPYSGSKFNYCARETSLQGWVMNNETIILLSQNFYTIVVLYNGDKKSFFDFQQIKNSFKD